MRRSLPPLLLALLPLACASEDGSDAADTTGDGGAATLTATSTASTTASTTAGTTASSTGASTASDGSSDAITDP